MIVPTYLQFDQSILRFIGDHFVYLGNDTPASASGNLLVLKGFHGPFYLQVFWPSETCCRNLARSPAGKTRRRRSRPMPGPALEVADIFRDHGAAWRSADAGHVSLDQLKVISAIERSRTAALGGHVARCENEKCAHTHIAYNSCLNRHCPKCQGATAREWLAEREAELLPVPYFHVVFSLPPKITDIAYQNKAVIYDLLFKASAETTLEIAATPRHLGARIGFMSVLHTWGSALTHHPHVHMVVPGGACRRKDRSGSPADRAISCRWRCSRPCSAGFWRCCSRRTTPANCSSSAIMCGSPTRLHSRPI